MSSAAFAEVSTGLRVISAEEILRITSSLPCRTSCALNWPGIEVHRYRQSPADVTRTAREREIRRFPQLAIFLCNPSTPFTMEVTIDGRKVKRTVTRGSVSITPAGMPHTVRCEGSSETTTVIFLDAAIMAQAASSIAGVETPEVAPQIAIEDDLIRSIGEALDSELESGRATPKLYIESLTTALSTHIIAKYATSELKGRVPGALTPVQRRRSIDFMKENLARTISLGELAESACMSKYHFAKSFKLSLGVAPHQYLVRLRVERARQLLAGERMSIDEVANSVGYADTSHFVQQFRRHLGVTPSHYRRLR